MKAGLLAHTVRQDLEVALPAGLPGKRLYLVEPSLAIVASTERHYGLLKYSRNSTTSTLLDVLPEPLVKSYRSTQQGSTEFRLHHGNTYQIYYSYANVLSRNSLQAQLYYNHNSHPIDTHDVIAASHTTSYIISGRRSSTLYASLNTDYYLGFLNTTFRTAASAQRSYYTQNVNEWEIPLVDDYLTAEVSLRTHFHSIFDISVGADWRTNRLQSDGPVQLRHSTSAYADLQFTFGPVLWTTTIERLEPGVQKGNPNAAYFLDSEVQWTVLPQKLTLYISGNNLLNSNTYIYYSVDNLEAAYLRYDIAPIRVMAGGRWQL